MIPNQNAQISENGPIMGHIVRITVGTYKHWEAVVVCQIQDTKIWVLHVNDLELEYHEDEFSTITANS